MRGAEDELYRALTNPELSRGSKVALALALHTSPFMSADEIKSYPYSADDRDAQEYETEELGFYGNVWVRSRTYAKAGDRNDGHKHNHDHVSLVVGKMLCHVEGMEPTIIENSFHIVPKEHEHYFVALTDNCKVFCVYAMHDVDGESAEFYGPKNVPWKTSAAS